MRPTDRRGKCVLPESAARTRGSGGIGGKRDFNRSEQKTGDGGQPTACDEILVNNIFVADLMCCVYVRVRAVNK